MDIIQKSESIILKKTRYFTGIKCKNGHISERYTKSSICCECKRLDNLDKKYKYNRPDNYYKNYAERRKQIDKKYQSNDCIKNKRKLSGIKYKSKIKSATFNDEFTEFVSIESIILRDLRTVETGIKWEVDHMIPLQAKFVCGLHVYNNIQVIPKQINRYKGNKMIFTSRNEWIQYLKQ